MWGISYPGFYALGRPRRRSPRARGGLAPGPGDRRLPRGRRFHNGAFMLAANFGFYAAFKPRAGGPERPARSARSNTARRTATASTSTSGRCGAAAAARPPGPADWRANLEHTSYDAFWQARSIWRHLQDVAPAVLTVGGWFDAEDLMGPLRTHRALAAQSPQTDPPPGDGPVDPRGLGLHGRPPRRQRRLRSGHLRVVPGHRSSCRSSSATSRAGRGRALPEATVFETGTNRWRSFDAWPPAGTSPRTLLPAGRRGAVDGAPAGPGGRLRPVRERPRAAGAVRGPRADGHAGRLHDRGPALRRHAPRRARLRDPSARGGPDGTRARSGSSCTSPRRGPTRTSW